MIIMITGRQNNRVTIRSQGQFLKNYGYSTDFSTISRQNPCKGLKGWVGRESREVFPKANSKKKRKT
jgi:hypothetical protein